MADHPVAGPLFGDSLPFGWNRRGAAAVCCAVTLNALLRRQAGVISRAQAISAGLSVHAVDRRLATGRWVRLHPSVYLVDGSRPTDEVRLRAAVLWPATPPP